MPSAIVERGNCKLPIAERTLLTLSRFAQR